MSAFNTRAGRYGSLLETLWSSQNAAICSVSVAPECISTFNELKLGKGSIKFIIYKLSDDYKQVVVEETSQEPEWDVFRNKLLSAKTVHKGKEGNGPRYAVYDFEYELAAGEGKRLVSAASIMKQRAADTLSGTR